MRTWVTVAFLLDGTAFLLAAMVVRRGSPLRAGFVLTGVSQLAFVGLVYGVPAYPGFGLVLLLVTAGLLTGPLLLARGALRAASRPAGGGGTGP